MSSLIEKSIGYAFKNKDLLACALLHSSVQYKGKEFERLEFLGDRVLGLVIAEAIYKTKRDSNEGRLAKILANLVSSHSCGTIAITVGIDKCIETANNTILRTNKTVLADAMEAVIGAIFIDSDFMNSKKVVLKLWEELIQKEDITDSKTQLQEISQNKDKLTPDYVVISKDGSDHDPRFTVEVRTLGLTAIGTGKSKKMAETEAARKMLKILQEQL
ncbi:MAG: ribonuclease III [Holosporales bacterium]|nr:ribonuclease III [Holosporales bacterium]